MVKVNIFKSRSVLLWAVAATILALMVSFYASMAPAAQAVGSSSVVKIYGNTAVAENAPGWLFNRDLSNTTPIDFNTDLPGIGDGSLYVLPLSDSDRFKKFIGEHFIHTPIADVNSISYDFAIGGGGEAADEHQFYMNVYANFGNTAPNKYYDCKYDVVPVVGVVNGYTTVTFDPTQAYPVTKAVQAWNTPIPAYDCPAVPANMNLSEEGSFIRMYALNLGDTGVDLSDADLDGYFDNVVVDTEQGTTTYDFESAPNKIPICHRTASVINPYEFKKVNQSAIDGNGNNDHSSHTGDVFDPNFHTQQGPKWGDIIPPVEGVTTGLNWTEAGKAAWEGECSGKVLGVNTDFTIEAQKVVCVDESYLPNWGAGGSAITADTAENFVLASQGACQLVDWEFQWAPPTANPGDNVESAGEPWTTFSDSVVLSQEEYGDGKVWIREVFSDGWVPFSGANKTQDYSAELYCGDDVLNYDNYDFINKPKIGDTYYCVAFNAPAVEDCEVQGNIFMIGDDESDQMQHPADELSWNGAFGDWSLPTDDPFVVPFSPDNRFVWNSNFNQGQGTDFEIVFYVAGAGVPDSELVLAWGPGRTGNEIKQVYLDANLIGTLNHTGTPVGGWYEQMQIFDDTVDSGYLTPGWHTLRLTHTQGDGTLWDFVQLKATSCDWDNEIQGRKFRDVNADGVFNNSEKNAEGDPNRLDEWAIYLFDSEWNEVDMMYTGDDSTEAGNVSKGQYRFTGVAPGAYYVCEAQHYGWAQTLPNTGPYHEGLDTYCFEVVVEGSGNSYDSLQFGNFELGQVNAWKFADYNGNGEQDEGDNYIEWDFRLYTGDWTPIKAHDEHVNLLQVVDQLPDSETEDEDSPWSMWNLQPGDYIICEDSREGWTQTFPGNEVDELRIAEDQTEENEDNCQRFTIDESGEEVDITFGNFPFGEIQGRKYHDVNANGDFDDEEKIAANRLNGWTIRLYDTDFNLLDSMVTGDDTTAAGNVGRGQYRFTNLALGDYIVCEVQQEGWVQTEPAGGPVVGEGDPYCFEVSINKPGQRRAGRQFGNYQTVGQIAGVVFNDENENLVQDPGELPLENWDIWLLTHNSPYTVRSIFTTAADGAYTFDNLAYGTYYICQNLPQGWAQTLLNNAGTTGLDPSNPTVGTVLDLEDSDVLNWCYKVELTPDNAESLVNDFGNMITVQGITTDNPGFVLGETTDGEVLGESVLAETGQGIVVSAAVGALTFLSAVAAIVLSKPRKLKLQN